MQSFRRSRIFLPALLLLMSLTISSTIYAGFVIDCLKRSEITNLQEKCILALANSICAGNTLVNIQGSGGEVLAVDTGSIHNMGQISQIKALHSDDGLGGILLGSVAWDNTTAQIIVFDDVQMNGIPADPPEPYPAIVSTTIQTTGQNANVRSEPRSNSSILVGIPNDAAVTAIERTDDNEWYLIRYRDSETETTVYGWIAAILLENTPDLATLRTIPNRDDTWEAFTLTGNTADGGCYSYVGGVFIQSSGNTPISFGVNGVQVYAGSTTLLQPQADGSLWIANLEGSVSVRDSNRAIENIEVGHYVKVQDGVMMDTEINQLDYRSLLAVRVVQPLLDTDFDTPLPYTAPSNIIVGWQCDREETQTRVVTSDLPLIFVHSYSGPVEAVGDTNAFRLVDEYGEVKFNNNAVQGWSIVGPYPASPPCQERAVGDHIICDQQNFPAGTEFLGASEYYVAPLQAPGTYTLTMESTVDVPYTCTIEVQ